ncbi:MAG: hypothetical protein V3T86_04280 [Planctomycetota bacterium]
MRFPGPLTTFGAVLVFCALAAAGGKSAKPVKTPEFVPVWDDAVAEAKALNLPLVIHRHGFY